MPKKRKPTPSPKARKKRRKGSRTKYTRPVRVKVPPYLGPSWDTLVATKPNSLIQRELWDRDEKLSFIGIWAFNYAQVTQKIPIVEESPQPGAFWVLTPDNPAGVLWRKADFIREHGALLKMPIPKGTISLPAAT